MQASDQPAFPTEVWDSQGIPQHTEGMTLRQYAAIKLKVPNSGTDWLDEMVLESLHNDFAAKAMQVFLQNERSTQQQDAWAAYQMADAMLKAREAK